MNNLDKHFREFLGVVRRSARDWGAGHLPLCLAPQDTLSALGTGRLGLRPLTVLLKENRTILSPSVNELTAWAAMSGQLWCDSLD